MACACFGVLLRVGMTHVRVGLYATQIQGTVTFGFWLGELPGVV